jgi:histidinol-phosphate aminotransferase
MTTGPIPKPWIAGIHAYVPGKSAGADGRALVKLSANENPLGCSPKALAAHGRRRFIPSLYPDGDSTAAARSSGRVPRDRSGADHHGVRFGRAALSGGASGYAGPGDEVLFSQYSFSLYDIVARRCGAQPVEAAARDYGTDVDAMLAAVTPRTRVVIVANPNNPTGTYLPRSRNCPASCWSVQAMCC